VCVCVCGVCVCVCVSPVGLAAAVYIVLDGAYFESVPGHRLLELNFFRDFLSSL